MPANTKAIFQEMFADFKDYYVLIGGTATSIVLDSQGFKSRTTKDYDMVIIDELKNKEFYNTLNHFLELGEYQGSQKDEKAQLFRFTTTKPEFPSMIELFSILPQYPLKKDGREIPYILTKMLVYQPYYWMKIIIIYWCMKKIPFRGIRY